MPYIDQKACEELAFSRVPFNAGELNFAITELVIAYIGPEPRYQTFNDAIGALEGAKLELYARMIRPYEDWKIKENGDVYPG